MRLLLDSGRKSVQVFVKDCAISTDVVTSASSIEGYCLHDLVELPEKVGASPTAGVIIGLIGQREVRVLLTTGKEAVVVVNALRGKIASGAGGRLRAGGASASTNAMDVAGNPLSVGDVVKVINSGAADLKDTVGTIKHIHKNFLYVFDFKRQGSAGIFVVRSLNVMVASTKGVGGPGGLGGGAAAARAPPPPPPPAAPWGRVPRGALGPGAAWMAATWAAW